MKRRKTIEFLGKKWRWTSGYEKIEQFKWKSLTLLVIKSSFDQEWSVEICGDDVFGQSDFYVTVEKALTDLKGDLLKQFKVLGGLLDYDIEA